MATHRVVLFEPYPFAPGTKMRITAGPRQGDWEVVAADAKTVSLRCPVSGREVTWKRFCYRVGEEEREWPAED
ncbi:MAG: hypothetical protein ACLF0G_06355 [Candidatus Brocadiia bacterium]